MKKRILSLIIVFTILFSSLSAFATGKEDMDYRRYLEILKETRGVQFKTPTPIFTATIDGKKYIIKPKSPPIYTDSHKISEFITVPLGTEINFSAKPSKVGSGNKMIDYDWQIYKGYKDGKYQGGSELFRTRDVNNIKLDEEGYYMIFLNVADDYKIKNSCFKNWSEKGDWRSDIIPPSNFDDAIQIRGWYYTQMKIKVVGEKDFSLLPVSPKNVKEEDVNIEVLAKAVGIKKGTNTKVILYDEEGQVVGEKNIGFAKDSTDKLQFKISNDDIKEGSNLFYAVINSDFSLTKADPVEDEKNLKNNKIEIKIIKKSTEKLIEEEIEEKSGDCEFSGGGRSETYEKKECVSWGKNKKGEDVCKREACVTYPIGTQNHAKLEYKEYSLGSNLYRADRKGQEFGEKYRVPRGKDLEGKPSYDELMSKIGYNPLYQVIQTGRGMQVKGVVRLTGGVQEFSSAKADKLIKDFVEDIKQNIFAGSKAKNNEGKEYQKMIVDTTRTGKYIVNDKEPIPYGDGEDGCKEIKRYEKTFEVEIPVIVSKATGTMDVIGANPKPKNPNEHKYFIYMNTQDGVYQMKLKTDINPSKLGVSLPKTSCIISPNEFKFAVYGSIFDLVNTAEDTNSDWDN